jgi:hypothetical protein
MSTFQVWLVSQLGRDTPVAEFMRTAWGWPTMESLHFIGLSLLVGNIAFFDLRLLGIGKRIPIAAAHRLVPWGIAGWGISVVTGMTFLLTEPDQYIYNPAFQLKMLFLALAGANAGAFYLTSYRQILRQGALAVVPRRAKAIAVASLCLWMAIIACGRLITFYRPGNCGSAGPGVIADCIPAR